MNQSCTVKDEHEVSCQCRCLQLRQRCGWREAQLFFSLLVLLLAPFRTAENQMRLQSDVKRIGYVKINISLDQSCQAFIS